MPVLAQVRARAQDSTVAVSSMTDPTIYAWVLRDALRYKDPIPVAFLQVLHPRQAPPPHCDPDQKVVPHSAAGLIHVHLKKW